MGIYFNILVYRVEKDDSILSIANKFNTTVAKIKQLNNVENVVEGERLVIEETGGSYVVGPFETLESISEKFGVSYEELKKLNGEAVFLGERIVLPRE